MAVVTRVKRLVANPQRRARKRAKLNPRHRRRMTAKQIKHFGTKAQKAALTRKRRNIALAARKARTPNPRPKVRAHRRRNVPAKRTRQVNPALLVTLGAVNPRGGTTVAARKRRKKAVRASNPRRRRRNTTRVVVAVSRRRNRTTSHRRRTVVRRRNPAFGLRGAGMTKAVIGGLAGMAASKFLPTLVPGNLIQGNLMRTVATGASAFVAQMIAKAVVKDQSVSDAVLFGGLMQTGSVALNAFLPGIAAQLGLSGIMDANWTIPENPLKRIPSAPAAEPALSGLAFAYGR